MPDLADAVLLAASLRPAEWTTETLSLHLDLDLAETRRAVADLRERGHLQQRRGNRGWGGQDRLRPSKAGQAA